MSTYDDASLIYYPSGYKASKAYSLKPTDGSGDLTFTRASTATRVNESGLIEEVATGVPRIDFTGGGCGKLLLEPQRTNATLRSNTFTNAIWIKQLGATVSTHPSILSPDGTLNSTIVQTNSLGAGGGLVNYNGANAVAVGSTKSIWARTISGTGKANLLRLGISSSYGQDEGLFDLTEEWQRFELTNTGATYDGYFVLGDGRSTGVTLTEYLVYEAQNEVGTYATSNIPTTTTAVTRTQDTCSKTGISSLIGQTEGTIYLEYQRFNDGDIFVGIINSASNYVEFNLAAASGTQIEIRGASPTGSIPSATRGGSSLPFTNYKVAIRYKENDNALFQNGVKIASDVTAFLNFSSANLTEFRFARSNGNQPFRGRISALIIDNNGLSDAQLIALTTI